MNRSIFKIKIAVQINRSYISFNKQLRVFCSFICPLYIRGHDEQNVDLNKDW